jgi:hypothetical protein
MKNIFIFSIIAFAISFLMGDNVTRNTSFQFIHENTEIHSSIDSTIRFDGMIYNLLNEAVHITIMRTLNGIPQDWNSSMCIGMSCYSPSTDSITIEIYEGDSASCGLSIQINGQGEGIIELLIFNIDNTSDSINVDISINATSTVSIHENEPEKGLVKKFALGANYPNPFNPSTSISYALINSEMVELSIYDMRGRLIRTLFRGNQILGYHTMDWNGTDGQGKPVPAGSYIYTIQVGNEVKTKKMTLLK